MQVFYVEVPSQHGLYEFPLIAACYPRRLLLQAKTVKEAVAEAWRIQQEHDVAAWDLIERMRQEGRDWSKAYATGPQYPNWVYVFDSETGKTSHIGGPKVLWFEIKSRKLRGRVFWFRTRPNDHGVYACEAKNDCAFDFDGHPLPPDQLGLRIGAVPDTDEGDRLFEYHAGRIAQNFYRKLLKGALACK